MDPPCRHQLCSECTAGVKYGCPVCELEPKCYSHTRWRPSDGHRATMRVTCSALNPSKFREYWLCGSTGPPPRCSPTCEACDADTRTWEQLAAPKVAAGWWWQQQEGKEAESRCRTTCSTSTQRFRLPHDVTRCRCHSCYCWITHGIAPQGGAHVPCMCAPPTRKLHNDGCPLCGKVQGPTTVPQHLQLEWSKRRREMEEEESQKKARRAQPKLKDAFSVLMES